LFQANYAIGFGDEVSEVGAYNLRTSKVKANSSRYFAVISEILLKISFEI
jgi:hypothetical protein